MRACIKKYALKINDKNYMPLAQVTNSTAADITISITTAPHEKP